MSVVVWKNISVLRGIAICLIVLAHSAHVTFYQFYSQLTVFSPVQFPFEFVVMIITKGLSPFGLPVFLFTSGFMLFSMYQNWQITSKAAFQIYRKYLIWAIPLFLFISLKQGKIDVVDILIGLINGGPMVAYWYFVLIFILYLISPIWIYLVKFHTWISVSFVILLQSIVFARFYFGDSTEIPSIIRSLIVNPLLYSPPFVLGLLFSKNTQNLITKVSNMRSLLKILTLISACLCIGESFWLGSIDNWKVSELNQWFATERISLTLFFLLGTLLIISSDVKSTKIRKWFTNIGLASLGIFLMLDISNSILQYLFWHVPDWIWHSSQTDYSNNTTPLWLIGASIGTLPFYFANGLWGPLFVMKNAKRFIGKNIRYLW